MVVDRGLRRAEEGSVQQGVREKAHGLPDDRTQRLLRGYGHVREFDAPTGAQQGRTVARPSQEEDLSRDRERSVFFTRKHA